jgi:hypothetical protein
MRKYYSLATDAESDLAEGGQTHGVSTYSGCKASASQQERR